MRGRPSSEDRRRTNRRRTPGVAPLVTLVAAAVLAASATAATDTKTHPAAAGPATYDPVARADLFERLLEFRSMVVGGTVEPHWLGGGSRFWYAAGAPDDTVVHLVDPAAGTREPLFDLPRLRAALAHALGHEPAGRGLPFADFAFTDDERAVTFEVDGRPFRLDLETYALEEVPAPAPAERRRAAPGEGELPSPDGRFFARIESGDLWLRAAEDGRSAPITSDGGGDVAWSLEGALWDPAGHRLALQRLDLRGVHRLPIVHWLGPEEEVEWKPYPFTGGALPQAELVVLDRVAKRPVRVDTGPEPDQRFHLLGWRPGGELLFLRLDREMRRLDLMAADPATGAARTLLTERSETFIEGLRFDEVADAFYHPLASGDDTRRFLWRSERDGWSGLYLYSDGRPERRLTLDRLVVDRVAAVDEAAGWVYFLAQGGDAHPYDLHLYRVSLQGGGPTRLTEAPGTHRVAFDPTAKFFVDQHSAPDRPPRSELRRADGALVLPLEEADVSALDAIGWQPPEEFTAKAADGETDLYGVLYRPIGFDPSRRYPLVEVIYGGPQGSIVPRRFVPGETCHFAQALAQLGFVTAVLDARGTPARGKAFQDVAYRNLGRHEIPDHAAALRQLAAARPYLDLERVGIWGKSWGGYFALRALLLAPDLYRAGVAWAPVAELESVSYAPIEPYMGRPADNPEGYAYASNLARAGALAGNLLLIIGTADENTPFAHTMRMVEALIRAGKPVDLLVLPGQHHWPEGASLRYLFDAVRRFFVETLGTERSDRANP